MGLLYGAYLLATLGCTYYVLANYLSQGRTINDSASLKKSYLSDRNAKISALAIVVIAWWLQDTYRHRYSPEAIAMKQIDTLLDEWQAGERDKVTKALDSLSSSMRPWELHDELRDIEH